MSVREKEVETSLTMNKHFSEDFHFVILAGAIPSWFRWVLGIWVFRCWLACLKLSAQGTGRGQMFSHSDPPFPVLYCSEVAAHTQMHTHSLFPEKLASQSCSWKKRCRAVSYRGTNDRGLNQALPVARVRNSLSRVHFEAEITLQLSS